MSLTGTLLFLRLSEDSLGLNLVMSPVSTFLNSETIAGLYLFVARPDFVPTVAEVEPLQAAGLP